MIDDINSSDFGPFSIGPDSADLTWPPEVPNHMDVLPDGEPALVIGDPQAAEGFNHLQGDNAYGFQEDCGLVSCEDILQRFGIGLSETDIVEHAAAFGECDISSDNSNANGGTTPDQQAAILSDYGVPAHVEVAGTLDSLAAAVESGHAVIAEVNAGIVWNDAGSYDQGEANHAVTVTGVALDPATGDVKGFYLNDSGNGKMEFVDAATMQSAWVDAGGATVVTDVNLP